MSPQPWWAEGGNYLQQIIWSLFITFFVLIILRTLTTAVKSHLAHKFYARKCCSLPVIPGCHLFGGHSWSIDLRDHELLQRLHNKYGSTFAWYHYNTPVVNTTDLDLLDLVDMQKENDHVGKPAVLLPMHQFANLRPEGNLKAKSPIKLREAKGVCSNPAKVGDANDVRLEGVDVSDLFLTYSLAVIFRCLHGQNNEINFTSCKSSWVRLVELRSESFIGGAFRVCRIDPALAPLVVWLKKRFHFQTAMADRYQHSIFLQNNSKPRQVYEQKRTDPHCPKKWRKDYLSYLSKTSFSRELTLTIADHLELTSRPINTSLEMSALNSSTLISFCLTKLILLLAEHQDVQTKLRHSVLEEGGLKSQYLRWVVDETLRLYPPASVGCVRIVARNIDSKLGLVPEGASVVASIYSIHRLEEYWGAEANQFRPDRWSQLGKLQPCQFMPFGVGKRKCPGAKFSLLAIKMLAAQLLRRYLIKPSPKNVHSDTDGAPGLVYTTQARAAYVTLAPLFANRTGTTLVVNKDDSTPGGGGDSQSHSEG